MNFQSVIHQSLSICCVTDEAWEVPVAWADHLLSVERPSSSLPLSGNLSKSN